jgi:hypothetical protein
MAKTYLDPNLVKANNTLVTKIASSPIGRKTVQALRDLNKALADARTAGVDRAQIELAKDKAVMGLKLDLIELNSNRKKELASTVEAARQSYIRERARNRTNEEYSVNEFREKIEAMTNSEVEKLATRYLDGTLPIENPRMMDILSKRFREVSPDRHEELRSALAAQRYDEPWLKDERIADTVSELAALEKFGLQKVVTKFDSSFQPVDVSDIVDYVDTIIDSEAEEE